MHRPKTKLLPPPKEPKVHFGHSDTYLRHCIKVAPQLHALQPDSDFALHLVALEAQVHTWYGFLHFRLIELPQFQLLTGIRTAYMHDIHRRAAIALEEWTRDSTPFVGVRPWHRAHHRRRKLAMMLDFADPKGPKDHERTERLRTRDWLTANPGAHNAGPRLATVNAWIAADKPGCVAPVGQWGACRNVLEHHGHRRCILCAFPFGQTFVDDGPQPPWRDVTKRERKERRFANVCMYLQDIGVPQQGAAYGEGDDW